MLIKRFCAEKHQSELAERKTIENYLANLTNTHGQKDTNLVDKILELKSSLKELDMKELVGIKITSKIRWC